MLHYEKHSIRAQYEGIGALTFPSAIPRILSYCCLECSSQWEFAVLLSNRTFSGSDWPLCHHRTSSGNARCQKSSELGQKKKKTLHVKLRRRSESVLEEIWRSRGLWERGRGKHGRGKWNVIPGQQRDCDIALPLRTIPQAVCFCQDVSKLSVHLSKQ